MICPPCKAGEHPVCETPSTCPCQHGMVASCEEPKAHAIGCACKLPAPTVEST